MHFLAEYLTDKGYDVIIINAKKKLKGGYFGYQPNYKQISLPIKQNWITKYILWNSELGGQKTQIKKNIFIFFRVLQVLLRTLRMRDFGL